MNVETYLTFSSLYTEMRERFKTAPLVRTEKWQSIDASKPEMATHELLNVSFRVPLRDNWTLDFLRQDIKPNLPWADDHFYERVGGQPLNPGVQWANWPHAKSADRFRDSNGQFSHTYMERFWPKHAGYDEQGYDADDNLNPYPTRKGIRFSYGDLGDVVELLKREPMTRQAYLPIFFPEDTGCHHGQRIPCTLGYHFIYRHDRLHIIYYLRSCDAANHLNDDIYLAVRLLLWVCEKVGMKHGSLVMHITSLHAFVNDYRKLIEP